VTETQRQEGAGADVLLLWKCLGLQETSCASEEILGASPLSRLEYGEKQALKPGGEAATVALACYRQP
jgi:hypothetical protein